MIMEQYAGIDVSLEASHVCVVDAQGKILKEAKVASEPEALIAWFAAHGTPMARIGLEAGPLSQWLFAGLKAAGLPVELLETRHVRALPGLRQFAIAAVIVAIMTYAVMPRYTRLVSHWLYG